MKHLLSFSFIATFSSILLSCQKPYDLDKAPMLSPTEAISDFEVQSGFKVELVAAEPHIESPVAIQFDENGRMWVVEMQGYMPNIEGLGEDQPTGKIKILEDTDGDGTYENVKTFMEGLRLPRAISIVKGGILLAEPPNLYFVENVDDKAGKRTLIDAEYADEGNVEHQPNGLVRGLDNWIYSAKGKKRYRFDGTTWKMEKTEFRGQWGISQDNLGRMFYNNNSTTLVGDAFTPNTFGQNPNYKPISQIYGKQLVSNRVFPRRKTTGVNRGYQKDILDASGTLINVTSACGVSIYRGDQFPSSYQGNAFIMEPVGFLIKRILLKDSLNMPVGKFAYKDEEFLTAMDERFRPVNATTAPDGSLFIVDMHRGIIQHTTYMTPYLRQEIAKRNLEQPVNAGRIFRIRYSDRPLRKILKLKDAPTDSLLAVLAHPNGFWRDTAQRLLTEKNDEKSVEPLKFLATMHSNKLVRLHALWTLEGMNRLTDEFLMSSLQSEKELPHRSMMLAHIKLLENLLSMQIQDEATAIAFVNAIGKFNRSHWLQTAPVLVPIAQQFGANPTMIDALLGGLEGRENSFRAQLSSNAPKQLIEALDKAIVQSQKPKTETISHLSKADLELFNGGKGGYKTYCATCHGDNGEGLPKMAPPLANSEWVLHSNYEVPTKIVLDGLQGGITVNGKRYAPPEVLDAMPGLRDNIETNNGTIANILTYIRNSWGNRASVVHVADVAKVRAETSRRTQSYKEAELKDTN